MNGYDRLRLWCDGPLDESRIHVVGLFVHIHKNRLGAAIADRFGGSNKRIGDGDNLVTWTDAQPEQGQPQRIRSAAYTDALLCPAECSEILFKLLDKRPTGKGRFLHNIINRFRNVFLNWLILRL